MYPGDGYPAVELHFHPGAGAGPALLQHPGHQPHLQRPAPPGLHHGLQDDRTLENYKAEGPHFWGATHFWMEQISQRLLSNLHAGFQHLKLQD